MASTTAGLAPSPVLAPTREERRARVQARELSAWWTFVPFAAIHLACFAAIWTGVYWRDVAVCLGLYFIRMFFITGAFHRYFSHRTFKTSRWFQFLLAVFAQTSAQRGALWWAAHHRQHHKYSDGPEDKHSPIQDGFWYSHFGWFFMRKNDHTETEWIKDMARYPELRFLDRWNLIPAIALGFGIWLLMGWSGLVVGFFWSTVLLWHGTFTINSLSHVWGNRRFDTTDDSRNNAFLALITLGEGWHNNHHHYQSCARQGFKWYEIDITYYILKGLEKVGLIWDVREPPARIKDA